MATQEERWERKKFLHASQIHAGNTIVVPQEKKLERLTQKQYKRIRCMKIIKKTA